MGVSLERLIVSALAAGAMALGITVVLRVVRNPETDDAIVTADVVDVIARVSGTISELGVADNQVVAEGELLFVIDPRPYEYAVQGARAEVAAIDGEIDVTERRIQGQQFAVAAARAAVRRAEAQLQNSSDSLARMEPLLSREFVTPDKIDQARTAKLSA